jgi:hypothetical protein
MGEITRVGVDLAKQVIQVHAVDAAGAVVCRRTLKRGSFLDWCAKLPPGCLVAMEACSGAHHWARQLAKLGLQIGLIAPHLVAPYRMQGRTGKNDANDAAAGCEAASRPQMHFVPVKTVEQQGILAVHVTRNGWEKDRTACINRIRALLGEFGILRVGSESRPRNAPAAARAAWAASPSTGILTCACCWFRGPRRPSCAASHAMSESGYGPSSSVSEQVGKRRPWRWPRRTRASCGRCSPATKTSSPTT